MSAHRMNMAAVALVLAGSCGHSETQAEAESASGPEPATENPRALAPAEAAEAALGETAAPPLDEAQNELAADAPIAGCGMTGTTAPERLGCAEDTDCVLSPIDFATCRISACGGAAYAYNCAFSARLAGDCDTDRCADYAGAGSQPCGARGGGGPSWEAGCVDGVCARRVATPHAVSRQSRVVGALSHRDVVRAFRRTMRRVEACLPPTITVDTRPVFDVVVGASGHVTEVDVIQSHDIAPDALDCARDAIREAHFPAARAETTFRHAFGPVRRGPCEALPGLSPSPAH